MASRIQRMITYRTAEVFCVSLLRRSRATSDPSASTRTESKDQRQQFDACIIFLPAAHPLKEFEHMLSSVNIGLRLIKRLHWSPIHIRAINVSALAVGSPFSS